MLTVFHNPPLLPVCRPSRASLPSSSLLPKSMKTGSRDTDATSAGEGMRTHLEFIAGNESFSPPPSAPPPATAPRCWVLFDHIFMPAPSLCDLGVLLSLSLSLSLSVTLRPTRRRLGRRDISPPRLPGVVGERAVSYTHLTLPKILLV